MSADQVSIFALLTAVIILFIWGRFRFDLVAVAALVVAVVLGLIPVKAAFSGFASSAVVTVAAVLVISRGLTASGAIERIAHLVLPNAKSPTLQMASLNTFSGAISAVINNVGALAMLMPATIAGARKLKQSPSLFLMPLAFASILGGMVTLIGTPSNIILASLREDLLGAPYTMFDFTPVGGPVALVGILFLTLVGWRLLPKARRAPPSAEDMFQIEAYTAEVKIPRASKAARMSLGDLKKLAREIGISILGLVRGGRKSKSLKGTLRLKAGDILVLETHPGELDKFAHACQLDIVTGERRKKLGDGGKVLVEAVLSPDSRLSGRKVGNLKLGQNRLTLLGVSRQGGVFRERLEDIVLRVGDVLLLEGEREGYGETLSRFGLLPLAERGFELGKRNQALIGVALLLGAIALGTVGVLDFTVALVAAALGTVVFGLVAPEDLYGAIDWPVIVLVGCMIPLGGALQTVGATGLIANGILSLAGDFQAHVLLALLLAVTMIISGVMNNVATAVVMAPVAVSIAEGLTLNPDTFLMAVAIGAACPFLTPIGHKNNAIVLGPGGYRFGDYWRMGLPLEILIILAGVPLLLWAWPL